MTTSARRTLLCLSLLVLAVPAAAAADSSLVRPPGSSEVQAAAVKAAASPGCRSVNVIEFRDRTVVPTAPRYAVRHTGRIRCKVRMRSRCHATLYQGGDAISEIGSRGRKRCRMASSFGSSSSYPPGTRFRQGYRYKLTLRGKRNRWAGTSEFCPKLSDNRRTLTCHDSHSTTAPRRHVDRHS